MEPLSSKDYDEIIIKNALSKMENIEIPDIENGVFFRLSHSKPKTKRFRPLAIAVYSLIAIILMTGSVMAVTNTSFGDLLSKINPSFAQILSPVQQSSIDQGIRMEVVAAATYDNMATAYITLQDMEGNRIDEEANFWASLKVEGGDSLGFSLADYDKEKQIATYLIEITTSDGFGGYLTIETDKIYCTGQKLFQYDTKINLAKLKGAVPPTTIIKPEQVMSGSYSSEDATSLFKFGGEILKPLSKNISLPEENLPQITAIGIINNKLHLQYTSMCNLIGNTANFYLIGEDEQSYYSSETIDFCLADDGEIIDILENLDNPALDENRYTEVIFDIADLDLNRLNLVVDFMAMEEIDGLWKVQADVVKDFKPLQIDCSHKINGLLLEHISANPFGITITGKILEENADFLLDSAENIITILTDKGEISTQSQSISYNWDTKEYTLQFRCEKPLDIDTLTGIVIYKVLIPLK